MQYLGEIKHEGEGSSRDRQSSPHAHWVGISADEKYLFSVDLGCDAVFTYDLQEVVSKISEVDNNIKPIHTVSFPGGTGPRHLIMSPDNKHAYVAGELSAEIFALSYEDGRFEIIEKHDVSASSEGDELSSDELAQAAIRITDDGRFVLISVRGTDHLWSFKRDADSGQLTVADHKHVVGIWPRDFNILSDKKTVIVANERSNSLNALILNPDNGQLEATEHSITMAAPSCILPL